MSSDWEVDPWGKICCFVCLCFFAMNSMSADAPANRDKAVPAEINQIEGLIRGNQIGLDDAESDRSVVDEIEFDQAPPVTSEIAKDTEFFLGGITVTGNTVLSEEEIRAIVEPRVGLLVDSAKLKAITDLLTQTLKEKGYVTSICVLPAQDVVDGVVMLKIIEDRLSQIRLAGASAYQFKARVFLDQLADLQGKVINSPVLKKRLRYLTNLPGVRLIPKVNSLSEGNSELVLNIQPLGNLYSVSMSNGGSRFTGYERATVSGRINNVTGSSDYLSVTMSSAAKNPKFLGSVGLNYGKPLGKNGGTLNIGADSMYYRFDPQEVGFDEVRYEGGSGSMSVGYSQPYWPDFSPNYVYRANWSVGYEMKTNKAQTIYNVFFTAEQPAGYKYVDTSDKLSVLRVGGDVSLSRGGPRDSVVLLDVSLVQALEGFFGAMTQDDIKRKQENLSANSEPVTGPVGNVKGMDAAFTKLYFTGRHFKPLKNGVSWDSKIGVEYSPSKKIPQSFKFGDADGGASGYDIETALSKSFQQKNMRGSIGYRRQTAYSWFRDIEPGCTDKDGRAQATSAGMNRCSNGRFFVRVSYDRGNVSASLDVDSRRPRYNRDNRQGVFQVAYRW